METFMAIVFLVFGILQIILFFKIWGMTNNVKKIKEAFLEKDFPAEYPVKPQPDCTYSPAIRQGWF